MAALFPKVKGNARSSAISCTYYRVIHNASFEIVEAAVLSKYIFSMQDMVTVMEATFCLKIRTMFFARLQLWPTISGLSSGKGNHANAVFFTQVLLLPTHSSAAWCNVSS